MASSKAKRRLRLFQEQGGKCSKCGILCVFDIPAKGRHPPDLFTVDHIFPESGGGPSAVKNLTGMCRTCNQQKGPTILEEFKTLNNKEKVQNIEVTLSWILPLIYAMCIITAVHLILTALLLYAQSH